MIERGWEIKNIIVETDLNLSNEKRDDGTFGRFMPFMHQSKTITNHFKNEPDFTELYYVPFYRYIQFDSKVGFRAFYKSLHQEPTNIFANNGYYPLGFNPKANMSSNTQNTSVYNDTPKNALDFGTEATHASSITHNTQTNKGLAGLTEIEALELYHDKLKDIVSEFYNSFDNLFMQIF